VKNHSDKALLFRGGNIGRDGLYVNGKLGDHRKTQAVDEYKALVDSRTGRVFSIATLAYKLITHEAAIERVEDILAVCRDLGVYRTDISSTNLLRLSSLHFPRTRKQIPSRHNGLLLKNLVPFIFLTIPLLSFNVPIDSLFLSSFSRYQAPG
jgi:hypothetical protein